MAVHGGVLGKDHYEVLGVAEEASPEDIQRACRRLARRHHPDANAGDAGAGTFRVTVDDLGDLGDLGDLLGDLFGGHRPASAHQGHDVEAQLHLSFEDAVFGVTTEVQARTTAGSTRSVRVRVPAGVEDGQRVRVAGLGGPGLDGEPVTVRIPPGTPPGRTLQVRSRGVPRPGGHRGDLLVTIEVAVPQRLTSQQRAAVEALAQAMDGSPRTHLEV